jgi:hypothetical protein
MQTAEVSLNPFWKKKDDSGRNLMGVSMGGNAYVKHLVE